MARTRKRAGVESYRAYVEALKAATSARKVECGLVRPAAVFAATCTGTSRLSREIGLPLACVGVAADPRATVEAMSRDSYGAWLPCIGRTPFGFERGWADWTLMHLGPDMAGAVSLGLGVELRRGS